MIFWTKFAPKQYFQFIKRKYELHQTITIKFSTVELVLVSNFSLRSNEELCSVIGPNLPKKGYFQSNTIKKQSKNSFQHTQEKMIITIELSNWNYSKCQIPTWQVILICLDQIYPKRAFLAKTGKWTIEGRGVTPIFIEPPTIKFLTPK